jgi:hypothetical protein
MEHKAKGGVTFTEIERILILEKAKEMLVEGCYLCPTIGRAADRMFPQKVNDIQKLHKSDRFSIVTELYFTELYKYKPDGLTNRDTWFCGNYREAQFKRIEVLKNMISDIKRIAG